MKVRNNAAWAAVLFAAATLSLRADWKQTGAGPFDYNDPDNWTDGVPNGVFPSTLKLTTHQTVYFTNDTTIASLQFLETTSNNNYSRTITFVGKDGNRTITISGNVTATPTKGSVVFGGNEEGTKLALAFSAGTTHLVTNSCTVTFNSDISGGSIDLAGTTAVTVNGDVSITGELTQSNKGALTLNGSLSTTGGFSTTGNGACTINGDITAGSVSFAGTGAKKLAGDNSHSGGTVLGGTGTISINSPTALGAGPVTIKPGAKLSTEYDSKIELTTDNPLSIEGNFSYTGAVELDMGDGSIALSGPLTFTGSQSLACVLTLGGQFSGDYSLYDITKDTKSCTLNYRGAFVGNSLRSLSITAGYLKLSGDVSGTIKAGGSGGELHILGNFPNDLLPQISSTKPPVKIYSTIADTEIGSQFSGTVGIRICSDIVYENLLFDTTQTPLNLDGTLTGGKVVFANAANLSVNGAIVSGSVEARPTATLYLRGDNTYAGGTDVICGGSANSGYVCVDSATAFGVGTVTFKTGARLTAGNTLTLAAHNPLVFEDTLYFSADGKVLNLGDGSITIGQFPAVDSNKGELALGGHFVGDYGSPDFVKKGGATVSIYDDVVFPSGYVITNAIAGYLHYYGKVTASSIEKKNGGIRFFGELELPDPLVVKNTGGSILSFNGTGVLTQNVIQVAASADQTNFNIPWNFIGDAEISVSGSKTCAFTSSSSVTGRRLVKAGSNTLTFSGSNGWTGGTTVAEGLVVFSSAPPSEGRILVASGARLRGSAACPITGLFSAGLVDTSSAGVFDIGADESTGTLDLSGYPDLVIGCAAASTLTGTIVPPSSGVVRLGSSAVLTLATENAISGSVGLEILGKVAFSAPQDMDGVVNILDGAELTLSGDGVGLPNADVVACHSTFRCVGAEGGTTLRTPKLTLQSGTLDVGGGSAAQSVHQIGEVVLDTNPNGGGGVPQLAASAAGSANVKLEIGTLSRERPVVWNCTIADIGATDFEGGVNVVVADGVANVGLGVAGTASQPIVPWIRNDGHMMCYDVGRGLKALDAATRTEYSASHVGAPLAEHENTYVPNGAVVNDFSFPSGGEPGVLSLTSVELLHGTSDYPRLYATNATVMLASGAIHLTSSNGSSSPPGSFLQTDLIDAGANPFYLTFRRGYNNVLNAALAGSGGLVVGDTGAACNTSKGMYLGGSGSTFTGDVYVFGSLQLSGTDVLPFGDRRGNLHIYGYFYQRMSNISLNAVFGNGRWGYSNTPSITATIGCDGTDGDYAGTVEASGHNLQIIKTGTGTQRFSGTLTMHNSITVDGGTLQLDGLYQGDAGQMLVNADGRLAGCGTSAKKATVKGVLAPGSAAVPEDRTLDFGAGLSFGNGATLSVCADSTGATSVSVAEGVAAALEKGETEAVVSVSAEGSAGGRWKILEAASFAPEVSFVPAAGMRRVRLEVVAPGASDNGRAQLWMERTSSGLVFTVR